MIYTTKRGDVLDAICFKYYGGADFDITKVYEENIGLASYGPILPAGLEISLPDTAAAPSAPAVISLVD